MTAEFRRSELLSCQLVPPKPGEGGSLGDGGCSQFRVEIACKQAPTGGTAVIDRRYSLPFRFDTMAMALRRVKTEVRLVVYPISPAP